MIRRSSPHETTPTKETSSLLVAGQILIAAGLVVTLFIVFEIFGTAFIQQQHQTRLRSQLEPALHDPTESRVIRGPLVTAPVHAAPAGGSPVAVLKIPRIGLDMVVVQGTSTTDLELGPGHYAGTPLPGEAGNVGIAGHRTTWARPFWNLDELLPGDFIKLRSPQGVFVYRMIWIKAVNPTDVAVLDPTAHPSLTLTTCTPKFSAAQRLVVRARLVRSSLTTSRLVTFPAPRSDITTIGTPSLLPSILLGSLSTLLIGGTILIANRSPRRWLILTCGGSLSALALLATFFVASPLLPANL